MVKPQAGDLVRITFVGVLDTDKSIFESTDERVARSAGIYSQQMLYGPRLALLGRGFMIPGLDEGISKMEAGQSAQIHVPAALAFGERLPDLVRVMSGKELERTGVRPKQGMLLNIDGVQARVKSVSSGRVVLDFNHPLAGFDLTYHVNLLEVVAEPEAKAKALGDEYHTSLRIERAADKAVIWIPKLLEAGRARGLAAQLGASVGAWADVKIES